MVRLSRAEHDMELLKKLLTGPYGKLAMAFRYMSQVSSEKFPVEFRPTLMLAGNEELDHVTLLSEMINRLQLEAGQAATPKEALQSGCLPSLRLTANVLREFQRNLDAEIACRQATLAALAEARTDSVQALLHYLSSRDAFHQNLWLDSLAELRRREPALDALRGAGAGPRELLQRFRASLARPLRALLSESVG